MASIIISMRHAFNYILPLLLVYTSAYGGVCKNPVYLTFDTGNMSSAEFIAQTLKQKNIRATFFLANNPTKSGTNALTDSWKGYWQARVSEGHQFGNHTWSHYFARKDIDAGNLQAYTRSGGSIKLNKKSFCAELTQVKSAFSRLTGYQVNGIWRAPAGRTTQNSIRWAADCGYPVHVGWSAAGYIRDDLPSEQYPNEKLLEKATSSIRKGDIILMHMGVWKRKVQAATILPDLIENLKARGFCFKTLGDPVS